jgi:anti-anti-sigma factor
MELDILEQTDALTRVALVGRLDTAGAMDVEKVFAKAVADAGKPAIVDLSQVSFIASMGMRLLISCAQALGRSHAALVLLNPQPPVEGALRLVGLTDTIHLARDPQEALALLRRGPPPHAAS